MLRNFITDEDLKDHYPLIARQIWSTQADYSRQIQQGFEHLQNDLWNKGINPRLCMIPLDLKATAAKAAGAPLVSTTESGALAGQPFEGNNQRRLVVNMTAHAGAWTIKLQGTQSALAAPPEEMWEDVSGAVVTFGSSSANGEQSALFYDQYKQYRYKSSVSPSGSATYTASLVEAIFDQAIINSTFKLIFIDFVQEDGDAWYARLQEAKAQYDSDLSLIKYYYDSSDSGKIDADEQRRTGQHEFRM